MDIPVDTDRLAAVFSGQVEPVVEWVTGPDGKRSPGEQARDEGTGHPLWTVHAMIASGDRPTLMAVRVPAPECPTVQQFSPARFERLEAVARVNRNTGQLAVYWSAAGLADPRQQGRRQPQGEQAPAA